VFPQAVGVFPQVFGVIPQVFGVIQKSFGVIPQSFGVIPQVFGVFPQAVGVIPQSFGVFAQYLFRVSPARECLRRPRTFLRKGSWTSKNFLLLKPFILYLLFLTPYLQTIP
jgi:hypothetical protein